MNKQHILDEIRRTAKSNGGAPLGHKRFEQQTGIRHSDWFGKYWGRWSDALREAGLPPNTFARDASSDDVLIEGLIALIRELGRFPGIGDLRLRKRDDPTFPNEKVFDTHFGSRARQRQVVIDYCRNHPQFDDVPQLCGLIASKGEESSTEEKPSTEVVGFVYLIKHGRHGRQYKIGKSNAAGRREYELGIQTPEKLRTVHVIRTDDPDGIEQYWHKRFAAKQIKNEWFELDPADVQAFKRRKFFM